jgi:hypothetical protein
MNETQQEYYNFYKELIEKNGGKVITDSYKNARTRIEYHCVNNHLNNKLPSDLKVAVRCQKCCDERLTERYGNYFNKFKDLIEKKEGKLLSDKYINNETDLDIECKRGHKFSMTPNKIQQDNWCIECYKHEKRMEAFYKYKKRIEELGGICLITEKTYKGCENKMDWICSVGHIQSAHPSGFFVGDNHCKICFGSEKITIEEMQEIAKKNGGECLSKICGNNKELLLWRCKNNHEWYASSASIKNAKSWCPACKTFLNEQICKKIFEALFGVEFRKCRPKFLDGLEYDGYNEELKLAFEYSGVQHYKFTELFHKTEDDFISLQYRDNKKIELSKINGITLIVIPYTIKLKKNYKYIVDKLNELNIKIPFKDVNIDMDMIISDIRRLR